MPDAQNDINDEDLELLIHSVASEQGYDFSNYAKPSFQRRIVRFYSLFNISNVNELIYKLNESPVFFQVFLENISVSVTEMYRDPGFYKTLVQDVFPALSTYPLIRIWHAGCATGEEVYSLCILLKEAGLLSKSLLYATDINPAVIRQASKGAFPLQLMKGYSQNYIQAGGQEEFSKYYNAKYNHAMMDRSLSERIIFSTHNLVSDASFNSFQLILCRNTLIYFNKDLQNSVLQLFDDSLDTLSFLALGTKETLNYSAISDKFQEVSKKYKIYKKMRN